MGRCRILYMVRLNKNCKFYHIYYKKSYTTYKVSIIKGQFKKNEKNIIYRIKSIMSNLNYKTWALAVGAKCIPRDDDIICVKLPSKKLLLQAVLSPLDPKVTTPERSLFRAMFDTDGNDLDDETISRIVKNRKYVF